MDKCYNYCHRNLLYTHFLCAFIQIMFPSDCFRSGCSCKNPNCWKKRCAFYQSEEMSRVAHRASGDLNRRITQEMLQKMESSQSKDLRGFFAAIGHILKTSRVRIPLNDADVLKRLVAREDIRNKPKTVKDLLYHTMMRLAIMYHVPPDVLMKATVHTGAQFCRTDIRSLRSELHVSELSYHLKRIDVLDFSVNFLTPRFSKLFKSAGLLMK
ncbi:hypothetical protein ACOME3_003404 [Neoechinorhynchus agilis]